MVNDIVMRKEVGYLYIVVIIARNLPLSFASIGCIFRPYIDPAHSFHNRDRPEENKAFLCRGLREGKTDESAYTGYSAGVLRRFLLGSRDCSGVLNARSDLPDREFFR